MEMELVDEIDNDSVVDDFLVVENIKEVDDYDEAVFIDILDEVDDWRVDSNKQEEVVHQQKVDKINDACIDVEEFIKNDSERYIPPKEWTNGICTPTSSINPRCVVILRLYIYRIAVDITIENNEKKFFSSHLL